MTARASTAIGLALLEVALVVRPEDEFALRHLPAAGNVLLSQLKRQLAKVDRNTEIVGYCRGPYGVLSFEAGGAAQEAAL
jgi:rhodanese-related sulfurtransferase